MILHLIVFLIITIMALVSCQYYDDEYYSFDDIIEDNNDEIYTNTITNEEIDKEKCNTNEYNCCFVTDTEKCDLSDMERGKATLVFPGFNTRCIHSNKGSFAFQVVPGDLDKVVFYLQGGGACLSKGSNACKKQAEFNSWSAFANKPNSGSPFEGYTIVSVLYCSGDFHIGNAKRDYDDPKGVRVQQRGLRNFRSTLFWVKKQQGRGKKGSLDKKLNKLVILGTSAGSIGAQLLNAQIFSELNFEEAAVLLDSFVGDYFGGSLFKTLKFCNRGLLDEPLIDKCNNGQATVADVFLQQAALFPNVVYAFINSKTDSAQGSNAGAYNRSNKAFERYLQKLKNVLFYLINGREHVFTTRPGILKTTDAIGAFNDGKNFDGLMLKDWIRALPVPSGQTLSSECEGEIRDKPQSTGESSDITYCLQSVKESSYEAP